MWLIDRLERRTRRDGPGEELVADGVRLCDGIALAEWGAEPIHLFHCDHCGGDDLAGGWVGMRRAGDQVLWLPAFAKMGAGPDDWARDEYAPPDFVIDRGIPVIRYDDLVAEVAAVPALGAIAPLTKGDVARMLQLESGDMLGRDPEPPRVRRPWLVSATEPSLDDIADRLDGLLADWIASDEPVLLAPSPDGDAICFWVDSGTDAGREWRPLAWADGTLCPRFDPGLIARPAE